jgi:hypothetical protein
MGDSTGEAIPTTSRKSLYRGSGRTDRRGRDAGRGCGERVKGGDGICGRSQRVQSVDVSWYCPFFPLHIFD